MSASNQEVVRQWYREHRGQLFTCPSQPGQLKISLEACRKRHQAAIKENFEELMKADPSRYVHKKGLALCQDCPTGRTGRLRERNKEAQPAPTA